MRYLHLTPHSALQGYNDCVSLRVASHRAVGIRELHTSIVEFAMSRKWYNEMLPESFIRLRCAVAVTITQINGPNRGIVQAHSSCSLICLLMQLLSVV